MHTKNQGKWGHGKKGVLEGQFWKSAFWGVRLHFRVRFQIIRSNIEHTILELVFLSLWDYLDVFCLLVLRSFFVMIVIVTEFGFRSSLLIYLFVSKFDDHVMWCWTLIWIYNWWVLLNLIYVQFVFQYQFVYKLETMFVTHYQISIIRFVLTMNLVSRLFL